MVTVLAQGGGGGGSGGSGTVTSVALTAPPFLTVSGSPVTTSGTLALTLATQVANTVFAGPTTGADATPTFRTLVLADFPAGTGSPLTTKGDLYTYSTLNARLAIGANDTVLVADSSAATGNKWSASLSGLTLILPTIASFANATHTHLNAAGGGTLSASAIASGTLALARGGTNVDLSASGSATAFLAQSASQVISARSIIAADLPTITISGDASGSGSGGSIAITLATVTVAKGGTGLATLTGNAALIGNGTGNVAFLAPGTTRFVMISDGTNWTSRALVSADIPSGSGSPLTTKGDIYTFSTVNARLAIGANDTVLVADSGQTTGNKWSASLSGLTLITPTIASFTNATHDHSNAAGGGTIAISVTTGILAVARGGTGLDGSATGGANQFVKQTSAAGAFTVAAILSADLTTPLTTPPIIGGTTPAAISGTIITATTRFVGPIIAPASNSTTAILITKADGSTVVGTWDTTNSFFGIGTTPSTKLHVLATTEQLRLGYDASNYVSATVSSTGSLTLALTGTTPTFTFSQAATITTSVTVPLIVGGSGTTQTLTYKTTTGTGASGADHIFQVGTNGGTEAMRILNSGDIGIGATSPSTRLHLIKTTEQLRIGYDTSNYASLTISSTGSLTVGLTGTSPTTTFSQAISSTIITASTRFVGPILAPASDSTTAIQFTKTDGSTVVGTIDTTNSRWRFGATPGGTARGTWIDSAGQYLGTSATVGIKFNGGNIEGFNQSSTSNTDIHINPAQGAIYAIGNTGGSVQRMILGVDTGTPNGVLEVVAANNYSGTVAVIDLLTLTYNSTGTPAAGYGLNIPLRLKSSTTSSQNAAGISVEWVVATHASRTARSKWVVYDTAVREAIRIEASGSAAMIGLFGVSAVIQPASANQAAVATTAATNVTPYGFTTQAQADGIITLLNQLRADMVALGSIKGSA